MNRLAILDWGIGGFGFWQEWKKRRPQEGAVYFSDSGFPPYGKVSDGELAARLNEVIGNLHRNHGITHCLIACHSASTVLALLDCPGVTITGIIESTVAFIQKTIPPGPLTIAGGRRTIESQRYPPLLPGHQINGIIAQPLSAAVEAGGLAGPAIHDLVRATLAETTSDLVLACTHYIALKPVIQSEFPHLRLHDPVPSIAAGLHRKWPPMTGGDHFLTSGSETEMRKGASLAFGLRLP